MNIIHVNSNVIKANAKHGDRASPLTLRDGRNKVVARGQEILIQTDPPVLVRYEPDDTLSCGARVWIETEAEIGVRTLGSDTFDPATEGAAAVRRADVPAS